MADTRVTSLYVSLGDDPADIHIARWTDVDGKECAALHVGNALTLLVGTASLESLRALSAATAELADWREQQANGGAK